MKFTNYNDLRNPWASIAGVNPQWLAITPKYNGVSCRLVRDYTTDTWHAQTRQGNPWQNDFFAGTEIAEFMQQTHPAKLGIVNCEILATDPAVKLATLAGWVSVARDKLAPEAGIKIIAYDAQVHGEVNYLERLAVLSSLFRQPLPYRVLYPPYNECAQQTFETLCAEMTNISGEGCVIRVWPAPYFRDENTFVDPFTIKRKLYHEEEGTIVAVLEGEGKRKNKVGAFIVRRNNGSEVKVGGGAGLTDELLAGYWLHPPINQQMTFRYEELSIYGTPLRPQFVAIRNYE